jgi:hypothetical protein
MKFIDELKSVDSTNFNTFTNNSNSNDGPLKNDDPLQVPIPSTPVIDVLQMPWYAGIKASKSRLNKIPRGYIIERNQKLNSLLSGAVYYLGTVIKNTKRVTPAGVKSLLGTISNSIPESATSIFTGIQSSIFKALEADKSLLERNNLTSLLGLYLTEETGFKYTLPYLNSAIGVSSNWGDEGDSALSGIVNKGMSIIDEISKVVNITQPGVYIQKPKYFNFDNQGKSVSFNFPLLNTINRDGFNYKSNYELLWLLAYQNKPFKTSFARTTPGKIYTVEIPGVISMPYAYISEMSVDFRGTIRQLPVDTPTEYQAPIPEAYVVNITFTSLLTDFGNTMTGSGFTTTLEENKVRFKLK